MVLSNLAGFLRRSIAAACFGPMTASDVVDRPLPLAGANAEAGTITMATARARAATSVLADNIAHVGIPIWLRWEARPRVEE